MRHPKNALISIHKKSGFFLPELFLKVRNLMRSWTTAFIVVWANKTTPNVVVWIREQETDVIECQISAF